MPPLSRAALAQIANYFKVLSELSRLQVLCTLKTGPKNVTEIILETGLGQANVSKHLKILTQAGIVHRQPKGVTVYYGITNPVIFDLCDLVCDLLRDRLQNESEALEHLERNGTI